VYTGSRRTSKSERQLRIVVTHQEESSMKFYFPLAAGALLLVALAAQPAAAQLPPPATEVGIAQLVLTTVPAKTETKLTVTSPAFAHGSDIPMENTQYRTNTFPGLTWTAGPPATKSYVIIMQDTDILRQGAPILHWTMVNIPATTTKLDPGMTTAPEGASHGPNMRGANQPYMGPRTPAGPKHRYHFQIFALDTTLAPEAIATFDNLTTAMKEHVLASGEIIGLGQAPPPPAPARRDE
jgi:para-nitrobenzyl esterase